MTLENQRLRCENRALQQMPEVDLVADYIDLNLSSSPNLDLNLFGELESPPLQAQMQPDNKKRRADLPLVPVAVESPWMFSGLMYHASVGEPEQVAGLLRRGQDPNLARASGCTDRQRPSRRSGRPLL